MSDYTESQIEFVAVGGGRYQLTAPIVWRIGNEHGPAFRVPKSFVFDVSIPKWARWLYSRHERQYFKAAALHDFMLKLDWDRVTAGGCFHDALKADGVVTWRRLSMWLAVSLWKYK